MYGFWLQSSTLNESTPTEAESGPTTDDHTTTIIIDDTVHDADTQTMLERLKKTTTGNYDLLSIRFVHSGGTPVWGSAKTKNQYNIFRIKVTLRT